MHKPISPHFEYHLHEDFYYECLFHKSTREAVDGFYQFLVDTIQARKRIGITVLLVDVTSAGLPPLQPFTTRVNEFRRKYPNSEQTIVGLDYKDSVIITIAAGLMRAIGRGGRKDQLRLFCNVPREEITAWLREAYTHAKAILGPEDPA